MDDDICVRCRDYVAKLEAESTAAAAASAAGHIALRRIGGSPVYSLLERVVAANGTYHYDISFTPEFSYDTFATAGLSRQRGVCTTRSNASASLLGLRR